MVIHFICFITHPIHQCRGGMPILKANKQRIHSSCLGAQSQSKTSIIEDMENTIYILNKISCLLSLRVKIIIIQDLSSNMVHIESQFLIQVLVRMRQVYSIYQGRRISNNIKVFLRYEPNSLFSLHYYF